MTSIESFKSDIDPDVKAEVESIMRMHSLSASDVWFKWESYIMNRPRGAKEAELDLQNVRQFRDSLVAVKREPLATAHGNMASTGPGRRRKEDLISGLL